MQALPEDFGGTAKLVPAQKAEGSFMATNGNAHHATAVQA